MGKCPISDAEADVIPQNGCLLVKPRGAAISYLITDDAVDDLPALLPDSATRSKLMTWVIDQNLMGKAAPLVDGGRLLTAKQLPRLSVAGRVERLYLYLERSLSSIDSWLQWSPAKPDHLTTKEGMKAWTESTSNAELDKLVEYAQQAGYVACAARIALTVEGWRYLEERRQVGSASDQGFVAMWFTEDMFKVYDQGIAPAIRAAGFRPFTIDKKEHNNKIDDEIIAEIRRSRFVVADFTCGTVVGNAGGSPIAVPRGGVYFEAGFARGLGLEVIWAVREDQINDVHFDTRQYNHIVWRDAADLLAKLTNRIRAVVGQGPVRP